MKMKQRTRFRKKRAQKGGSKYTKSKKRLCKSRSLAKIHPPPSSMWKAEKNGKWINASPTELKGIDEYRTPRTVNVPHEQSGSFIATFQPVPLEDNLEYVLSPERGGEPIRVKYNPTAELPASNKKRKWMIERDGAWVAARLYQEAAVMQYRHKVINVKNEKGKEISFYVKTVDTPGRDTLYTFTTEDGRSIRMKYEEEGAVGTKPGEIKHPPYTNAEELYALYEDKRKPPHWTLNMYDQDDPRMKEVQVYSTSPMNKALLQCLTVREPVNIEMAQPYKHPFDSGYMSWFKEHNEKELGPNLGIYARALMSMDGRYPLGYDERRELIDPKLVHVFNSIGFAFDNTDQPDYKYYLKPKLTSEKKKELTKDLTNALRLFLVCAKNKKLSNVCFCYLGGGFFKTEYERQKHSYIDLFAECMDKALSAELPSFGNLQSIYFSGGSRLEYEKPKLTAVLNKYKHPHGIVKEIRFGEDIPSIFNDLDTEKTLFMNAWDPHSVVGNGNESDRSLDGWFGRLGDLALLCTPATNPHMLRPEAFVQVPA